ncbi:MAG: hypothetical protein LBC59_02950 [Chitinispirillales bacterium]|jgi:hypothetical protein|nr:hypothetical protein [Chitinispirillales bacterium]
MTSRELAITYISTLPDSTIDRILDYILYQKYIVDKENDEETDIESIPTMMEIIDNGINTPWEECKVVPEDVYNAV